MCSHLTAVLDGDGLGFGVFGRVPKVPHDSEPRQDRQDVIGQVHLPPKPTLIDGGLIVMVIVVPAFSTAEKRKHETVPTSVVRLVPDSTNHVCERIDEERTMVECRRRNKKPPDEAWESPYAIDEESVQKWRHVMESVEETDLRIAGEVFDEFEVGPYGFLG